MAKFTHTYELSLGDRVNFRTSLGSGQVQLGTVQDLSEYPDVWVEVGDPKWKWPHYNRYKISVNLIENCIDNYDWHEDSVEFKKDEPIEFVYDENYKRKVTRKA